MSQVTSSSYPPRAASRSALAEISLQETRDPQRWAAACRASGQPVSPFHTYPWLELAADMTGTRFTPLIVRSHGVDVGVAPWLSRRRGPVQTVNWLPFPYLGPLVPSPVLAATMRRLGRRALRDRAVVQQFQFGPESHERPAAAVHGFEITMDCTWLVDTTKPEAALLAGLDKTSRKKIRQVERQGYRIEEFTIGESQIEGSQSKEHRHGGPILERVISAIFARRDLPVPYPHHFPPELAALNRLGLQAHWTVAVLGDVEVGALVALMYEGAAVAWVGGVLPEHQASNVNVLLYWEMIQWARAQGARSLDLVGIPNSGIDQFKSQFGGTRTSYPVLTKRAPGVARLQQLEARVRTTR